MPVEVPNNSQVQIQSFQSDSKASAAKTEEHKSSTSEQLSKLNNEVCEYLGDYQDQDSDLKSACSKKQSADSAEKIFKTINNLDSEFKKCESQPSCFSDLE